MFRISHTAILEIVITFVALSLRRTKFHEPEKYQNLLRKTCFPSSTCDHFLHRHKAESRLEIDWLHQERGSHYFPIHSSTQLVCKVCDSQLLRASSSGGSKNKSLRWKRTNEVDGTLQIKDWKRKRLCSVFTGQATQFSPNHFMKLLPIPHVARWSWNPKSSGWGLDQVWISPTTPWVCWAVLSSLTWIKALCLLPLQLQHGYPSACCHGGNLVVKNLHWFSVMDAGWGETPLCKGTLGFIPLQLTWADVILGLRRLTWRHRL